MPGAWRASLDALSEDVRLQSPLSCETIQPRLQFSKQGIRETATTLTAAFLAFRTHWF
jgi:hypothetical protein